MPSKPYGGILPSTRARSKALYEAYGGLREVLKDEQFVHAVGKLNEAHRQAKTALSREYGLRKHIPFGLARVRKREKLPVVLHHAGNLRTITTTGELAPDQMTGLLDSFKREVETHLFVTAPAHAAMKKVFDVINQAPKMVLDPDETARTLKPETERIYGTNVKTAAGTFLKTGNIEQLEDVLNDLATVSKFSQPRIIGNSITKNAILHFVANLKRAMEAAHKELTPLEEQKKPSEQTVEIGRALGIDVRKIHGVAFDNIRWKTILPHRIKLIKEFERRNGQKSTGN